MSLINRSGFSTTTEVEASSFSVWNCVITFLQILLVSTILYGSGLNTTTTYDVTPEYLIRVENFRGIAFFFCVWALQSVALALLLVWAIGKRSYHLCHSWVLSETLMQVFIVLSAAYFAYRSSLENGYYNVSSPREQSLVMSTNHSANAETFRPPKHLAFLIILHFLIKSFGFWIVCRYMKLLKATDADSSSTSSAIIERVSSGNRYTTPPPSYTQCKDDPPCYEDALKMGPNHSSIPMDGSNTSEQIEGKDVNVPV